MTTWLKLTTQEQVTLRKELLGTLACSPASLEEIAEVAAAGWAGQ